MRKGLILTAAAVAVIVNCFGVRASEQSSFGGSTDGKTWEEPVLPPAGIVTDRLANGLDYVIVEGGRRIFWSTWLSGGHAISRNGNWWSIWSLWESSTG